MKSLKVMLILQLNYYSPTGARRLHDKPYLSLIGIRLRLCTFHLPEWKCVVVGAGYVGANGPPVLCGSMSLPVGLNIGIDL